MKCELIEFQWNPMLFVEIRGFRQRVRKKQVLTPTQFQTLLCNADLRLQVMMTIACCLGLRPSEFLGLQWPDLDVSRGVLMVSRSITGSHVDATKTPDSEDEIVLDADVLALLVQWKEQSPVTADQWLFPNVDTGRAVPCRFSEGRSSAPCRADDWHPESRMVCLPAYVPNNSRRRGNSDWCAAEADASLGRENDHEPLRYCLRKNQTPGQYASGRQTAA
jgi:integrase